MSETANICSIAELLSAKIFGVLGWTQHGPLNFNFQVDDDPELKRRTKHPCDVVFGYEDPYNRKTIYFLADLKSYAKSTMDAKDFKPVVTSLSAAVRAAHISEEFRGHLPEENYSINGLLFVYNHDNKYDKDLLNALSKNPPAPPDIPPSSCIYTLSPTEIQFLNDVYNDLEKIFGESTPLVGRFRFFYPNLTESVPEFNEWKCATIEMIQSAYLPVFYDHQIINAKGVIEKTKHVNFYYKGDGETYEEFCFIFDYLFRFRVIDDEVAVRIVMPNAGPNYQSNFGKAKGEFIKHFYTQDGAFTKLERIETKAIPTTVYTFHEIKIGMNKRKEFSDGY